MEIAINQRQRYEEMRRLESLDALYAVIQARPEVMAWKARDRARAMGYPLRKFPFEK